MIFRCVGGDWAVTFFAPHVGEKFDVYNYNLKRVRRRFLVYDDNSRMHTSIDILLSNTTLCMAVEVKRWLETKKDVDDHKSWNHGFVVFVRFVVEKIGDKML